MPHAHTPPVLAATDERLGTSWSARADAEARTQLMVGLMSRFNHDLRTPLNTILGWTHLLQQGAVDAARGKHVAEVIARNSREQTVLLEEFVDDARAVLGVLKLELADLQLEGAVAGAIERVSPMLNLHAVVLQQQVDLDAAAVHADGRRLPRLLYRLLAVVARRAPEAGVIQLQASIDGRTFHYSVDAPAQDSDWSDAALLDLRLASYVAAMHGGELDANAHAAQAAIHLSIPLDPR